jgi:hypothetical protein
LSGSSSAYRRDARRPEPERTDEGVEWQAVEGGGHIIEPDGKISVNNQDVVRAWERSAHWVGWITPPSVVSYNMLDAENKFWVSGEAAFQLGWSDIYELFSGVKPFRDKAGATSVPAGKSAQSKPWEATLWGSLAIQLTVPKPSSSSSSSSASRNNSWPRPSLNGLAKRWSTLKFHLG